MKKSEGDRILLRTSSFDDCRLFAEWETNPQVTQFFTIDKGRTYEEIVTEYVQRKDDADKLQLTVCLKDIEKPIGRIYISNIDHHYDSLDITRIYIADPALRGKGYGEEALRLALKLAFEDMGMERVTLDHFTSNVIARNLYEKVGFTPEGIMRNSGKKDGVYVDLYLMSILREEYFAKKEAKKENGCTK